MEMNKALSAFGALSNETRLSVFRLLIKEGSAGLPAGEIAERLTVPPSTLSVHLARLERSGLLISRRVQRRIFYAADIEGVARLLDFLVEDCCQGRPELCDGVRIPHGGKRSKRKPYADA